MTVATSIVVTMFFAIGTGPANAGSICKDGSWTASEGRGTCSHHGGVAQSGVSGPGGGTAPAPVATQQQISAPTVSTSTPPTVPSGSTSSSSFINLVKEISVSGAVAGGTYSRSLFKHWIKQSDGCTTRQVVLIQEAIGGQRSGCYMIGATWYSAYDGKTVSSASSLDIDHMVPLKEAWVSYASMWSPARRQAYANDLGYADSLVAVTASSNRSKSDRDPANWMPPNAAFECTYVESWVAVKYRCSLTMDPAEKNKVDSILARCPAGNVPMPSKAA